jgi:DNA modification methylase
LDDYKNRKYLSATEAARFLDLEVKEIHRLTRQKTLEVQIATSGQKRYDLGILKAYRNEFLKDRNILKRKVEGDAPREYRLELEDTVQKIFVKSSMEMDELEDESVHLMITSPPYYNAKMYSREPIDDDLGNIHDLDSWFDKIGRVWSEVYRVLQPGRKAFINIMNLPVRENSTFKSLNLVGRTIDLCEELGFIFKRDIVWHKTNSVKAHFGTFPYPGGILLNHMHEFILEFQKPDRKGFKKYGHLTKDQKEASKLDKGFWLEIKSSDVWVMTPEKSGDSRSHVAPFPYILPFRLVKAYSYIGETVLDPFSGSGTVLQVSKDMSRDGIGYEINPEIAERSYEILTTKKTGKGK